MTSWDLQLCKLYNTFIPLHFLPANQDICSPKLVSLLLTSLGTYQYSVAISRSALQFSGMNKKNISVYNISGWELTIEI